MDETDKITLTCKILIDERFWEIKRDNEKLRLKLFWKKYNIKQLTNAMINFNESENGTNCDCLSCRVAGRSNDQPDNNDYLQPCKFKPIFEDLLKNCELMFGSDDGNYSDFKGEQHVSNHDKHLVVCPKGDWVYCLLGKKLWQSNSVKSPELIKYKKLFKLLNNI